jgi:hypothetical protein
VILAQRYTLKSATSNGIRNTLTPQQSKEGSKGKVLASSIANKHTFDQINATSQEIVSDGRFRERNAK